MTLKERISNDIERLLRPVDPGELELGDAESANLEVRITIRYLAKFAVRIGNGRGPLPSTAIACNSWDDARTSAERRATEIAKEAESRLESWAGSAADDYMTSLAPTDCMEDREPFGVTEQCRECEGRGSVECPQCQGRKKIACPACGGSGKTNCQQCHGSGKVSCGACHGQGYHEKSQQEVTVYEQQKTSNQRGPYVRVPCSSCNGSGKKPCISCGTTGKVACSRCHGFTQVDCPTCSGKGRVPCKACDATGSTHRTAWIECTTERTVHVDVEGGTPEDLETVGKVVALPDIQKLAAATGGVKLERWNRDNLALTCEYTAVVPCEWIEARSGPDKFVIRGYGPDNRIFDYHGLIDSVLEGDLADLEQRARGSGGSKSHSNAALKRAVHRFLDSEVNVQLLEATQSQGKKPDRSPDAAESAGIASGHELLTGDYRKRATSALLKALARLHRSQLRPALLIVTAAVTILMFAARHGLLPGTGPARVLTLFLATCVTWFVVELGARRKLKAGISRELWKRIRKSFRGQRRLYRLLCLAGFLLAWYASLVAMKAELHFRDSRQMSYSPVDGAAFWK